MGERISGLFVCQGCGHKVHVSWDSMRPCPACGRDLLEARPSMGYVWDDGRNFVTYLPLTCPECYSEDVGQTSRKGNVRYKRCRDCGHKFKVIK